MFNVTDLTTIHWTYKFPPPPPLPPPSSSPTDVLNGPSKLPEEPEVDPVGVCVCGWVLCVWVVALCEYVFYVVYLSTNLPPSVSLSACY